MKHSKSPAMKLLLSDGGTPGGVPDGVLDLLRLLPFRVPFFIANVNRVDMVAFWLGLGIVSLLYRAANGAFGATWRNNLVRYSTATGSGIMSSSNSSVIS